MTKTNSGKSSKSAAITSKKSKETTEKTKGVVQVFVDKPDGTQFRWVEGWSEVMIYGYEGIDGNGSHVAVPLAYLRDLQTFLGIVVSKLPGGRK